MTTDGGLVERMCRWCERNAKLNQYGFCDEKCESLARWMEWPMEVFVDAQGPRVGDEQMADGRDFPNSGILFKNDKKREARDRDYQGSADITCACGRRSQFWLSAWLKEGSRGKFLGLAFKPKDAAPERAITNIDSSPDRRFSI